MEINKKRPSFIKSKERVAHIRKKLNTAKKSLAEVVMANEAHQKDIDELDAELKEVEKRRHEYEEKVAGESQSQGRDVQLEDAQVHHVLIFSYDLVVVNSISCNKGGKLPITHVGNIVVRTLRVRNFA